MCEHRRVVHSRRGQARMRRAVTSLIASRPTLARPHRSAANDAKGPNPNDPLSQNITQEQLMSAFGLGAHRNDAAQFRDLKLESRVAALFAQSLSLAQHGATTLHPDDLKAKEQADAVRERLARRLHELEEKHYDSYEALLAFLVDHRVMPSVDKEKKNALDGVIPGTVAPPWKDGSQLWSQFVSYLLGKNFEDKQEEEAELDKIPGPMYVRDLDKFPWLRAKRFKPHLNPIANQGPVEELDDPNRLDRGTKKGHTCLLCGPDRHKYPLEPMNLPLLTQFLNPSGFLLPRRQTGLCIKMHNRVGRTVKQARTMGLFSYKKGCFRVINPVDDTPVEALGAQMSEEDFAEFEADTANFADAKRSMAREVVRDGPAKKQAEM